MLKKGDHVDYSGRLSGKPPMQDQIISGVEPAGAIFNQPMATLEGVHFWVSLYELTLHREE
jgi:hypothetical protein